MRPIAERFWSKVDTSGDCWIWTGHLGAGYGSFGVGGRRGRMVGAHRVAYALTHGPVPDGLEVDHLCRVRSCVNPAHLEAVTHAENSRRSTAGKVNSERLRALTHCIRGHAFDDVNTHIRPTGARRCRVCDREASMRRYYARRAAA